MSRGAAGGNRVYSSLVSQARKATRITVRMTSEQAALIAQAAQIEGMSSSAFTAAAALARAGDVLTAAPLFTLDEEQFDAFRQLLDRPAAHQPRLDALFRRAQVFDQ